MRWTEKVDRIFAAWDEESCPGCALGIYRDGEMVYERGYGCANIEQRIPITAKSVFHTASLSKQFTAMAVALLAQSGRLSMEDEICRYVPEMACFPRVTFRHAIHHTSGLRDQWDLLRMAGWRAADLKTTG